MAIKKEKKEEEEEKDEVEEEGRRDGRRKAYACKSTEKGKGRSHQHLKEIKKHLDIGKRKGAR